MRLATMSEAYWAVWNAAEQAKMDADIERYRKADGRYVMVYERGGSDSEVGSPFVTRDVIKS